MEDLFIPYNTNSFTNTVKYILPVVFFTHIISQIITQKNYYHVTEILYSGMPCRSDFEILRNLLPDRREMLCDHTRTDRILIWHNLVDMRDSTFLELNLNKTIAMSSAGTNNEKLPKDS